MHEETKATNTASTAEEQSLLFRIVAFPKYIGQFVFDIIKYSDAADYFKIMVGYGIIIVIILLLMGTITPDALASLWRFFFPVS